MANYKKIIELRPEMADFLRNRRNIGVHGDVLSYGRDIQTGSFSTDSAGFRHTVFQGKTLALADCLRHGRYGIILGASNTFGFGVAGNENSLGSLLSDRFGFPFVNASMPGANSRNLHSLLVGLIARAPTPPVVVAHSTGGDLGNFCDSSIADPIFGSPNRSQLKWLQDGQVRPDAELNFPRLLSFSMLWASVLEALCRAHGIPFVLVHQSTFLEKTKPTKLELECGLGEPYDKPQALQLANHRRFDEAYFDRRKSFADSRGIPLAGWGITDKLTFIDEFHCDREGMRLMSKALADQIEPLLEASGDSPVEAELTSSSP